MPEDLPASTRMPALLRKTGTDQQHMTELGVVVGAEY
jgi:hypothetical protein